MTSELRKTGISVVGDVPWGTHFCYFYETTQDLLDTLVPYFMAGLKSKEFCLWIISHSELLTLEQAKKALGQALPDLERHLADGSIEIVTHEQWFQNGTTFNFHRVANRFKEKLDEALARGYAGMRVNGSPAWLQKEDKSRFLEFEQALDNLFPTERIIASCTYPLASTAGDEIFDVARRHQFAIAKRSGQWEVVETPALKQAKAEIERLNEELEQRVVKRTNELILANEQLKKEIVERKQAEALLHAKEQEFRAIVENAPDQIIRYDREFRRTYVNPAVAHAYGLPVEALIGKPIGSVIQDAGLDAKEEELTQIRQRIKAVFDTGTSFEYELTWPTASGRRSYSVRLFPELDLNGAVINVLGISRDITERKQAEEQLRITSERLRKLSASFQSAREEEGTRIARELHDELGSALTSLRWDLENLDRSLSDSANTSQLQELRAKIEGMIKLTIGVLQTVKRISSELRPQVLDDLGLADAVEWQAAEFQARTGIVCECDSPVERLNLNQAQATAVFRILQEALTNVLRHAQATKVNINLKEELGKFVMTVVDNGRGITEAEKAGDESLGLLGMRERAELIGGTVDIKGIEGIGTTITISIDISG